MVNKFKPKNFANRGWMECDICERIDFQFLIHLKPERFSKNLKKGYLYERAARQVCFNCALHLFSRKIYNFSHVWRETFFDSLKRVGSKESKKLPYMVIHK